MNLVRTKASALIILLVAMGAFAQSATEEPRTGAAVGVTQGVATDGAGESAQGGAAPPDEATEDANPWSDLGDEWEAELQDAGPDSEQDSADQGTADLADDSIVMQGLQTVVYLFLVLAIFLVGAYFFKRVGQRTKLLPAAGLADVIGRVHLAPKVTLHFVRTGNRVLVVGVNTNAINLITEFGADELVEEEGDALEEGQSSQAQRFLEELRVQQGQLTASPVGSLPSAVEDGDVASLKDDIARLQQLLREASHDAPR
jgi:flagellar biogenesis protein FliO